MLSIKICCVYSFSRKKKAKQFDKLVGEWKRKVDGLAMDLDVAQKECRNASSELFKVKLHFDKRFYIYLSHNFLLTNVLFA